MAKKLPAPRACQHIMDTGRPCGSPALRGNDFCYWHHRAHNGTATPASSIPLLESGNAIQLALTEVSRAVFSGKISPRQATSLFYGLQISVMNLKNVRTAFDLDRVTACTPAMTRVLDLQRVKDISGEVVHADVAVSTTVTSHSVPAATDDPEANMDAATGPAAQRRNALARHVSGGRLERESLQSASLNDTNFPASASAVEVSSEAVEQAAAIARKPSADNPDCALCKTNPIADPVRHSIFHPDPEAVRAYWTGHLPSEVATLRGSSGELIYEPPDWLPLTREQIDYLADHQPRNYFEATPEELENYERLIIHSTRGFIPPPTAEQILETKKQLDEQDQNDWMARLPIVMKEMLEEDEKDSAGVRRAG
jgi:hypothetical protein